MALAVNARGLSKLLATPADVIVRFTDQPCPVFDEVATEIHRTMPHVLVVTHNLPKYSKELAALPPTTMAAKAVQEVRALPATIFYFHSGQHAMYTGGNSIGTLLQTVRDTYDD